MIPIKEAIGYYLEEDGKVYSAKSRKYMVPHVNTNGYYVVELIVETGKRKKFYIHRLLAEYFIPNDDPVNKTVVNHKDENRLNNSLDNLEWLSRLDNLNYGTARKRNSESRCIKIDMLDDELNVIRTFDSAKEAAAFVNRAPGTLTPALKNPQKTCGGYHWKYHDPGANVNNL